MKKLLTILLIAAGSLSAFSQKKGDYEVGVNIGGNFSSVQYPEQYVQK